MTTITISEALSEYVGLRFWPIRQGYTQYGFPVCVWQEGNRVLLMLHVFGEADPLTILLSDFRIIYALERPENLTKLDIHIISANLSSRIAKSKILWQLGAKNPSITKTLLGDYSQIPFFKRTPTLYLDYLEMTLLTASSTNCAKDQGGVAGEIMRNYEIPGEPDNYVLVRTFVNATLSYMDPSEVITGWDTIYKTYFRRWHRGRGRLHDDRT